MWTFLALRSWVYWAYGPCSLKWSVWSAYSNAWPTEDEECTSYCNVRPRVPWLWATGGRWGAPLKCSRLLWFSTDNAEADSILSAETRLAKQEALPGVEGASEQHKHGVTLITMKSKLLFKPFAKPRLHSSYSAWNVTEQSPLDGDLEAPEVWLEVPVLTDFLLCFSPLTALLPTTPNTLSVIV